MISAGIVTRNPLAVRAGLSAVNRYIKAFVPPDQFRLSDLFLAGETGSLFYPARVGTLHQTTAMKIPARSADPVGMMLDQSQWGDAALGDVYGPELVTNGGFDDATGWVQDPSWTISGGVATSNSASGYDGVYYDLGQLVAGKTYKITIEIKTRTSGGINVYPAESGHGPDLTASTVGVHTAYITRLASATYNGMTIRAANGFVGTVDNISVREVTVAQALMPVLGPELVTNGSFDDATGWTTPTGWTISGGKLNGATGAFSEAFIAFTTITGWSYVVELDITVSAGNVLLYVSNGDNVSVNTTGRVSVVLKAGSNGARLSIGGQTFTGTVDNVSVREIPGDHYQQATAADRLTYGTHPVMEYGSELVTNGTFATDLTGWTFPEGWVWDNGKARDNSTGTHFLSQTLNTKVGGTYSVTFDIGELSGGSPAFQANSVSVVVATSSGHWTATFTATTTTTEIRFNGANAVYTVDNVSVREITASRRNLLLHSENFHDTVWTKTGVSLVGKLLTVGAGAGGHYLRLSGVTPPAKAAIYARVQRGNTPYVLFGLGGSTGYTANFNLDTLQVGATYSAGGGSITSSSITLDPEDNNYVILRLAGDTGTPANSIGIYPSNDSAAQLLDGPHSNEGASVYVDRMMLENGAVGGAYQKVVTKYEVTEAAKANVTYASLNGLNNLISAKVGDKFAGALYDVFLCATHEGRGACVFGGLSSHYIMVVEQGSGSVPYSTSGTPTTHVNNGGNLATRGAVATAWPDYTVAVVEVRGADLSAWTDVKLGFYSGFAGLRDVYGFLIVPSADVTPEIRKDIYTELAKLGGIEL